MSEHHLKFPFAPLFLRAQRDSGLWRWEQGRDPMMAFTFENLADMLGVTRQAVQKMAGRAVLGWVDADKYACRLGYHPVDIWPDWFERVLEEDARKEALRQQWLDRRERQLARAGADA